MWPAFLEVTMKVKFRVQKFCSCSFTLSYPPKNNHLIFSSLILLLGRYFPQSNKVLYIERGPTNSELLKNLSCAASYLPLFFPIKITSLGGGEKKKRERKKKAREATWTIRLKGIIHFPTTSSSVQHFSISFGTGFFTKRCRAFPAS